MISFAAERLIELEVHRVSAGLAKGWRSSVGTSPQVESCLGITHANEIVLDSPKSRLRTVALTPGAACPVLAWLPPH